MDEHKETASGNRWRRSLNVLKWLWGICAALALVLYIASYFLDEPLRNYAEKTANRYLKGYSVRLQGLHLQLVGFTITIKGLTVLQQAFPEPPIARLEHVTLHVSWRELLSGKVVATAGLVRPKIHLNLQQLKQEATNKGKDRGWQKAIEEVYPLKIDNITITDGDIMYIDREAASPLHLTRLNLQVGNIRNIHLPDKVYPSTLHMDTVIFGTGKGAFDGRANFLSEPVMGIKGDFRFEKIPVSYFTPIITRANLSIKGGEISTTGSIEYSPNIASVRVKDVTVKGLHLDYFHTAATAAGEKRRVKKAGKAASAVSNKPKLQLRVDRVTMNDCDMGLINKDATPKYRVFVSDLNLHLKNLSNHFEEGPAEASLTGKFMGSGTLAANATFRPEKTGPDFAMRVKIENTQLKAMNDLFRAYGKFDVSGGLFYFYSDLTIRNNAITGYVKPLFKDIKVYDQRKDKDKKLFRKLYEMLVGGVAKLLENRPRQEMATRVDVGGQLQNPQVSTWQTVVQLVRNAFFKAILPGFEREVTGTGR